MASSRHCTPLRLPSHLTNRSSTSSTVVCASFGRRIGSAIGFSGMPAMQAGFGSPHERLAGRTSTNSRDGRRVPRPRRAEEDAIHPKHAAIAAIGGDRGTRVPYTNYTAWQWERYRTRRFVTDPKSRQSITSIHCHSLGTAFDLILVYVLHKEDICDEV